MQFSIFMIALSPSAYGYIPSGSGAYAAQYSAILGPIFLTVLLMFVSGLMLQERPGAKKRYGSRQGWEQYTTLDGENEYPCSLSATTVCTAADVLEAHFVFGISDMCSIR